MLEELWDLFHQEIRSTIASILAAGGLCHAGHVHDFVVILLSSHP